MNQKTNNSLEDWNELLFTRFITQTKRLKHKIEEHNPGKILILNQYAAIFVDALKVICIDFDYSNIEYYPSENYFGVDETLDCFLGDNSEQDNFKVVILEKVISGDSLVSNYKTFQRIVRDHAQERKILMSSKSHTPEEVICFGKAFKESFIDSYLQKVEYFPIGIVDLEQRFAKRIKNYSKDYRELIQEKKAEQIEILTLPFIGEENLNPNYFREYQDYSSLYIHFLKDLSRRVRGDSKKSEDYLNQVIDQSLCLYQMRSRARNIN